ncbi:hypothetical protein F2Q68_00023006 [Brassica cretica]|uniref:Xylanase inhibitor N-terminal domain-containing protein n=1 Tax=Brassica cretica TaxID=69181 RepID=A0A8S9FQU5_BRACR|nr:hypothetical protein F2Q68_00023006 [Brassica cretica]
MLVITLALVHSSAFVDTLSDGYKWLARSVVIAPGLLIFPFCPRPWPMKEKLEEWCVNMSEKPWFRSILYDLVKGGGAIACYYGSNYLGTFLQIITDPCLIHATVSFTFFLLTLDFLYDFEEVIELCDNFVFACYGLMINENQRKIRHFFVHATCVLLCVFKSFLRSNMQLFLSKIEKPEVGLPLTVDQAIQSGQAIQSTPPSQSPPPSQSGQAIQSTPPSQSPPPSQSNPGDDTSGTELRLSLPSPFHRSGVLSVAREHRFEKTEDESRRQVSIPCSIRRKQNDFFWKRLWMCAPLASTYYSSLATKDLNEYNPSASTTSKVFPCSHKLCESAPACESPKEQCPYTVTYASYNTTSSGLLVEDVLHLAYSAKASSSVKARIVVG